MKQHTQPCVEMGMANDEAVSHKLLGKLMSATPVAESAPVMSTPSYYRKF